METKIWDYEDMDGGLEDCIFKLLGKRKTIVSITILKYITSLQKAHNQPIQFPIRALILYNN